MVRNVRKSLFKWRILLSWRHIEEKIDDIGRSQVWGESSDWSKLDMDSEFEAELLVYDQMLTTVSPKIICGRCLKADEKLWKKVL